MKQVKLTQQLGISESYWSMMLSRQRINVTASIQGVIRRRVETKSRTNKIDNLTQDCRLCTRIKSNQTIQIES